MSEATTAPAKVALPAIEVEHISASYRVRRGADSPWAAVTSLLRRDRDNARLIPALTDVSLSVPRGSVLGVIGRNGAGKSTLLRCMAGIIPPTEGRVVVRGNISALLSAGFGFNKSLSGRENIELGALAFGFTEAQVRELAGDIADFAQLGEYVDLPMRTYSSGMSARLGVAVAAHLDPEILLMDEALGGGDSKFKERTAQKMETLCGEGRTIVIVSHGLSSIRAMATRCVWLHQGKVVELGYPDDVVSSYMRYCRITRIEETMDGE